MYRRSMFMEILLEIREEMSREADYDVDLFAEMIRSGKTHGKPKLHDFNGAGKKRRGPRVRKKSSKNGSPE